jgi:DHA3 family tetracycline resistance protein-like MFS transporter
MKHPEAYRVYLVMNAVVTFASALMFTVMAIYYVVQVKMDPLQLVLVGTAVESTIFIFEIPTGIVADMVSRRLSVIAGMFILGAAFVLEGSLPVFAAILLAEALRGVGETFLSGAKEAWLAGEVGDQYVGTVMLRSGQLDRLAGIAGIIASVALASLQLNLPIVIGGGLYLALGVFLALRMREHGFSPTPREERTTWQTMRHTFREGRQVVRRSQVLLMLLGVAFVAGAASEGFDRLNEAHLLTNFTFPLAGTFQPVVWFGVIGVAGDLVSLAVTEVVRKRLEAISRVPIATARALRILSSFMITAAIVFGLAGSFALAVVMLMLHGLCRSVIRPLYNAWLIQNVDPAVRATVLSMVGQTDAIGQVAGGPGIGLIGSLVSIRAAIVSAGVLLAPVLLLYSRASHAARDVPQNELDLPIYTG